MVNFYFDELTREAKCFSFNVIQEEEVKETKPAFVVVYDYYKKELYQKMPYSINNDQCNLVPVQEDIIVKTEAQLLGVSTGVNPQNEAAPLTSPPSATSCPRCYSNLQEIGNWEEKFCASKHAYWAILLEDNNLSIASYIRFSQDILESMLTLASFSLAPECTCSPLTTGGVNKRLLIMTRDAPLVYRDDVSHTAKIRLHSDVAIVPLLTHRSIRGKRNPAGGP
ncbi:hypothetical protein LSAT2_011211 [Lamellibrachia satsuma]|nr:hypothetical protein LSAT2_011211 [Lamellibrachia satsuma]